MFKISSLWGPSWWSLCAKDSPQLSLLATLVLCSVTSFLLDFLIYKLQTTNFIPSTTPTPLLNNWQTSTYSTFARAPPTSASPTHLPSFPPLHSTTRICYFFKTSLTFLCHTIHVPAATPNLPTFAPYPHMFFLTQPITDILSYSTSTARTGLRLLLHPCTKVWNPLRHQTP